MEEAAKMIGFQEYCLRILISAGHLTPLGKPAKNARKWFATVEIERMCNDIDWLNKAVRIVEKEIKIMNQQQNNKYITESKTTDDDADLLHNNATNHFGQPNGGI